jgi:DNA topoisomerase-1
MASQMSPEKNTRNTITLDMYYGKDKKHPDQLESIVEIVDFNGWKVLFEKDKSVDSVDIEQLKSVLQLDNLDPDPLKRTRLYHKNATGKQEYQRTICRFTESSLIAELEKKGIGRPSTFSNIMTTISPYPNQ